MIVGVKVRGGGPLGGQHTRPASAFPTWLCAAASPRLLAVDAGGRRCAASLPSITRPCLRGPLSATHTVRLYRHMRAGGDRQPRPGSSRLRPPRLCCGVLAGGQPRLPGAPPSGVALAHMQRRAGLGWMLWGCSGPALPAVCSQRRCVQSAARPSLAAGRLSEPLCTGEQPPAAVLSGARSRGAELRTLPLRSPAGAGRRRAGG